VGGGALTRSCNANLGPRLYARANLPEVIEADQQVEADLLLARRQRPAPEARIGKS